MTGLVRPATGRDIDAVTDLLHRLMNPKIPRECWRRLLDYPWRPDGVERGWLVEDEGRVVGFMATVYSDRDTSVGLRRFCDLGAWYLERSYRGSGIGDELLRAGMAQPGVTYATMTARAATGRKIRALGFTILDDTQSLFHPRPGRDGGLRLDATSAHHAALPPAAAALMRDHRGLGLREVVVSHAGGPVLLLLQEKRKGEGILYHDLLHCSDLPFLAARAQALADLVVTEPNGVFAVDTRFLQGASDLGSVTKIPLARWFRSPDVPPREMDHLYSETLLLDMKLP